MFNHTKSIIMRKRLLKVSLALAAALVPSGLVLAQAPAASSRIKPEILKMSPAQRAKARKAFASNHPLLAMQKTLVPRTSAFTEFHGPVFNIPAKRKASGALYANPGQTLWANLAYKDGWTQDAAGPFGYYSLTPTDPLNLQSLYETTASNIADHGVEYSDGKLYGLSLDLSYAAYGIIEEYLYTTDTETGETTSETLDYTQDLSLAAVETAQADDGTVYGEFYNSEGSALEWGTVDYSTKTRTTIGPATNSYVALGITKEGQLYGVASDGNLYKIDKATGTETLVGPTGLTVSSSDGYYGQTGEIDQKDNTFYWYALDANGNGGLYEINLSTGAATLIAAGNNQLYGMVIPSPAAADGAPAKITDAALDFSGASLSGTLTFTAPAKTFAGADLTGEVTYTVKANDAVVATGTATAGAAVSVPVTVPASGLYNFTVTTSNAAGESPKAKLTKWIGYDVPSPVTGITATNAEGVVTVNWTAPTTGTHDGVIGDLTYDVYRISNGDTTEIAKDIVATTTTDDLTGKPLASYVYAVKAKAEGQESALATSAGVTVGNALEPDWTETFDNEADFNLFTVIDANGDGKTWSYSSSYDGQTYAKSTYNSKEANDDWLITPPLHFTPGRLYTVTFKVENYGSTYANSLEVKYGKGATAADMTNTLMETYTPSETWEKFSFDINPDADGNFYIGFHDNSDPDKLALYIDSIVVEKGALASAPQAVTNFTITPGDRGALKADLAFTAPTLNVGGNDIAKVDSFQILRDGVQIATLPAANAGANVTYTDNAVPTNGTHKYTVVPYIDGDFGLKASATAYIGQDIPATPKDLTLLDNTNNILAMWNKFEETGTNGGYVNPANVHVSFFNVVKSAFGYDLGDSITTSEKGATKIEIPQDPEETTAEDGKTQTFYIVGARADGDAGSSAAIMGGPVVIGPSIKLPFKESFKGGNIDNGFAWVSGNDQYNNNEEAAGWLLDTENTADGDGGSAAWHAYSQDKGWLGTVDYTISDGDETSINTPKISLRGATNPKLFFSLYATANDPVDFKVFVQTPDGVDHLAKSIDLSTNATAGWSTQEVDLSDFASERYIMVRFDGLAKGSDVNIGVDNVNIFDQLEYNLAAAGISVPATVKAGSKANVDVYVENFGAHPASDYSVVLYANDKAVDTVAVSKELAVLAKDTVTLTLPVAINQTEDVKVKAEVVYANDLDEDDNTTETKSVKVKPSQYTKVNDLKAEPADKGVNLSWTAPTAPDPVSVTEDFESYAPFATELGDWTLVDGDKGLAGGFFQSLTYPGQGTAFAFDAFNPNAITDNFSVTDNNPGLAPHSGDQFAGAPYVMDATGQSAVDADNWLISPELSGKKQTVKFYVFNITGQDQMGSSVTYAENFDVLYSTTDQDTASFVKLESDIADGTSLISEGPNWKEISVELPAGAKYFAIHHNTPGDNNFLFGIDDVTFEKVAPGANDSIVGFKVYRDGEYLGEVDGKTVAFADADADTGSHVYNVTVLYQDAQGNINESGFSNDASITVTGIDGVEADAEGRYNVYTIDGKTIMLGAKSLKGLKSGLYIINDRKYIIK